MGMRTRYFWRELGWAGRGWQEQEGPPPDEYLADAVRISGIWDRAFQVAVAHGRPLPGEGTLYWANDARRFGSIRRHILVDEAGTVVYAYSTSRAPLEAFVVLVGQARKEGWNVLNLAI